MTGTDYANLVASYLARRFAARELKVYREVRLGKTILGKDRCLDVFCVSAAAGKAFAIECKYQDSQGTVDEKIPYALDDLRAMPIAACIAYAGGGFSPGVLHMLRASSQAAYCLPDGEQTHPSPSTRELDHVLALHFVWWDELIGGKTPVSPEQPAMDGDLLGELQSGKR